MAPRVIISVQIEAGHRIGPVAQAAAKKAVHITRPDTVAAPTARTSEGDRKLDSSRTAAPARDATTPTALRSKARTSSRFGITKTATKPPGGTRNQDRRRAAATNRTIVENRAPPAFVDHNRELAHLVRRQDEVAAAIEAAKTRLADATSILDEHDHPLHRRGHRPEIAQAKVVVRDLPSRIGQLEDERHELTVAIERERAARDRTARRGNGPDRADADRVSRAFDSNARVRGERAAEMGQDDYAFTHHAVQRAVADLNRSFGVHRFGSGAIAVNLFHRSTRSIRSLAGLPPHR